MGATTTGQLAAFLGPSLPADEARRLVPGVELLPPICQGDLSTVVERARPRAILIVDGEFGQSLSVWHKEILHAIHLGIRVIGASSMGALRAAELERFGMEGVGEIFAHYRNGWLTADADVALLHADAADGYRVLTIPLVNVRATLQAVGDDGLITSDETSVIMGAAEALHFTERTPAAIAKQLRTDGLDSGHAERLVGLFSAHFVDQKARDAAAGLDHLARIDEIPPPDREDPLFRDGRGFQPLLWSDVVVDRPTGSLRRYQLVNDVTLHHRDVPGLLRRAVDRQLVAEVARQAGVSPTSDEVAEQRSRMMRRLGVSDETLDEWLAANDLDGEAFDELVRSEATGERTRRWYVDLLLYERMRRLVIEQLQLDGDYAAAADAAARRRTLADAQPTPPYPTTPEAIVELVRRHVAESSWRPHTDLVTLADEHGFDNVQSLIVALADASAASAERLRRRDRAARMLGIDPVTASAPRPPTPDVEQLRMLSMLEAHQVTHVLLAADEVGIPSALAAAPMTTAQLADATGSDATRLDRLLRALQAAATVTLGDDGRWTLTPAGRTLARHPEQATLGDYAAHLRDDTFDAWGRLADVVRGEEPPSYPVDERADRLISAATDALGLRDAVVRDVEPPPGAHVVDIGGGLGGTLQALIETHPGTTGTLVELPDTAARAAAHLAESGAVGIEVIAADDVSEPSRPADRCLLGRVIVTLDDETAIEVLRRARRWLAMDGTIEVFDLELDGSQAAAFGDVLNLARSGGGVRTSDEWRRLGERAGLRLERRRVVAAPFVHLTFRPADDGDQRVMASI